MNYKQDIVNAAQRNNINIYTYEIVNLNTFSYLLTILEYFK